MRKLFTMILLAAPLFTLDTAALARKPKVVIVATPNATPPPPVVQVSGRLPPPRVVVEQPMPPPPPAVAVVGAPVAAGYYGSVQMQGVPTAQVVVQPMPVVQVSAEGYMQPPPPQQVVVAPGCNQMDDSSLQALTEAIQAESFSSGQLRVIADAAQGSCFSVAQVAQILPLLSFEDDKLKALHSLARGIWDRQNAFRIYSLFTFDASKEKARQILSR